MHWLFHCTGCDQALRGRPGEEHSHGRCPACLVPFIVPGPPKPPKPAATRPGGRAVAKWSILGLALLLPAAGWLVWPRGNAAKVPHGFDAGGPGNIEKGKGPRKLAGFKDPVTTRATVVIPGGIDAKLAVGPDTKAIRPAGRIGPVLAAAYSPRGGPVFVSTPDARLLVLHGTTFGRLGEYRLPGAALHLALDPDRGRLLAAVCRSGAVRPGRFGERGPDRADLMAFDTSSLSAGKPLPGAGPAHPLQIHRLDALVHGLALGGGNRLYFLAETPAGLAVSLLDTLAWKAGPSQPLPGGAAIGLSLCPERGSVYALAGGYLHAFGPLLDGPVGRAAVGGTISSPAGMRGGIVLLIERRVTAAVLALDLADNRVVARWPIQGEGRFSLHPTADGTRVFLSSSAVLHGRLWAIGCAGGMLTPTVTGEARAGPEGLLRGTAHSSPDGAAVILGNGTILRRDEG